MPTITYDIDPGGDIEIVLNKPNDQRIIPTIDFRGEPYELDLSRYDSPDSGGRYYVINELYPTDGPKVPLVDSKVRMRVSSRHLILASSVFRAMLNGPWSEASSSSQPLRQITTTGWDPLALAIVLDIIHGRHREIPEDLTIGLVARIATIVDYYDCHEVIYVYRGPWLINNRRLPRPRELCETSLLHLYICGVFSHKEAYYQMLELLLKHSEGLPSINTFELPIGSIVDKFEKKRRSIISDLLELLQDLQDELLNEKACALAKKPDCPSLSLGVLMRARHDFANANADVPLEYPYNGYSVDMVIRMIKLLHEPRPLHSNRSKHRSFEWGQSFHPCSIGGRLYYKIESVESDIWSFCRSDRQGWIDDEPPDRATRKRKRSTEMPSTEPIVYNIDTGGDAEIILNDASSQQIVPNIKYKREAEKARAARYDGRSDSTFDNPPLSGIYTIFNTEETDETEESQEESFEVKADTVNSYQTEVRFRVSSRHLILASHTFRAMLEGPWSESTSRQIKTSGWDAKALAIVLDAIHGRYDNIPKIINLGLLVRIATIVNYYDCHESVRLLSDVWIANLRASSVVPTQVYCKTSRLWLYASSFFSKVDIAIPICKEFLDNADGLYEICLNDLPLGRMSGARQAIIVRAILDDLRETLSTEDGCTRTNNPNCSAMMLGLVIREQYKLARLDPPLTAPYNGHKIEDVVSKVLLFPNSKPDGYIQKTCPCNLGERLLEVYTEIGSELSTFDWSSQKWNLSELYGPQS
ncbi:hypothetical protein FLONG3_9576 [Fusarium longipes]|uniref:BTB domain-containing protein n=1 Tax=Fusarium longipes TaxID=694270 RepID=A0A395RX50_9HYPO|nr:hypothetical protein FLONG3_9576 [Fusarium longipes]